MRKIALLGGVAMLSLAAWPGAKGETAPAAQAPAATAPAKTSLFAATAALDIAGMHDFADANGLSDEAATQLAGLCSLDEFQKLPQADRHVYSFEPWPAEKDDLGQKSYCFNFHLGNEGVASEKVVFVPNGGGPGGVKGLVRGKDAGKSVLRGFGNLDWSGVSTHVYKFDKPVIAFGVVLKSTADFELRKFHWANSSENGYPVSYTLADGSIIQVGARELRGALVKGDSNAFIGVIDRSGRGIVSVSYTIRGLAGNKAQAISMCNLAFATLPKPAAAEVINLRSSCDFEAPDTIAASPTPALPGLATLDAFRFIVGNHRYVYRFDTWPKGGAGEFSFDLKGKGAAGQKVTVKAATAAGESKLTPAALKNEEGLPYQALGGLGDIGKEGWAEQTFKFEKPVWGFGVTYRSSDGVKLGKGAAAKEYPVSYTLSDGTVVNVGSPGEAGGVMAANGKTFVGVIDHTDKGIAAVTVRVQGGEKAGQSLFIEDLAFALAGPPPGDWKLTLADEFNGDKLDPKIWTTGYKFVDVINSELQGFVPENVTVANGICTIKVEQRECLNTDRFGNTKAKQKFASGAFTSADKFTQTYGYFESRLRMPKARGAGVWPAFWVLPDRGREYPDNVRYAYRTEKYGTGIEIDIFEFMPRWQRVDGLFPVHVGCIWSYGKISEKDPAPHGYGGYALDNDGWGPAELDFPKLDSEFHTYGLYWSPQRLIYYVDSKPVYRVRDAKHVPDVPHYFIYNVAVHGNGWGKSPDKKNPTMEQIIEDMPNAMEIDYFRAYSGTLEEAIPTPEADIPGVVNKYSPPPKGATSAPAPATTPAPASAPALVPATGTPAAPVNSGIATPSN